MSFPPFSLTQLHYFVTAARTLNLTQAGRECYVSQPSISGAIQHLEDVFQTQLFIRHPSKGMLLTPSGKRLLELGETLLNQANQLESRMQQEKPEATLKVGCLMTLEALIMPAVIQLFQQLFSGMVLEHETTHQQELLEMVRSGDVEIGLTYDMEIEDGLNFSQLGKAHLPPYAIVASDSTWACQDTVSLHELAEQPLVLLDIPVSRDYFLALFEEIGVRPNIAHRGSSLNIVCSMVANGLGYSILNAHSKTQTTQDGKQFVARPFVETLLPLRFGAVWSERQPLGKTATAFLGFCQETVAQWMPDLK